MKRLALALALSALPLPVAATDDWQQVATYALASKQMSVKVAWPWLDTLYWSANPDTIRHADGSALMRRPRVVASAYDRSVRHDLSRFYRPDKPRLRFKMRYAGRRSGEVISFGIDTGYAAEKIRVRPALFLGYARAIEVRKNFYLTAGISGYLGGRVSEEACFDAYDRAYYCPTLTAWSDYRRPKHRAAVHGSLVFTYLLTGAWPR